MPNADSALRPRLDLTHSHNFMPEMLARCQALSIAPCEFCFCVQCYPIPLMHSVGETRLARLQMLLKKYSSLANLNEALGLTRTDATLSQIKNQSTTSRGKPKFMGEALARRIEADLGLEYGWMDTPPTYAEIHGEDDPRSKAHIIMDSLADDQVHMVLRLLTAVAQPPKGDDHPKAANG
jgi:hypothetical protein